MPQHKSAANAGTRRAAINFVRKIPAQQWEHLKTYIRTGKNSGNLSNNLLRNALKVGLDYAEARSVASGKPYLPKLTYDEKAEIRRQVKDFADIFYPHSTLEEKSHIIRWINGRIELVQRKHIEEEMEFGNRRSLYGRGRMYLRALDPDMEFKAKSRAKKRGDGLKARKGLISGFENNGIVLERDWHKEKYTVTTPMHEAVHYQFGSDEYFAYTVDFYYSMKKGFMKPEELRTRVPDLKEAKAAYRRAVNLYRKGERDGWEVPEKRIRAMMPGKRAAAARK
jgi:hypothetical protein